MMSGEQSFNQQFDNYTYSYQQRTKSLDKTTVFAAKLRKIAVHLFTPISSLNLLKKIKSALVSVFDKSGLDAVVKKLNALDVEIISTGGTQSYLESLGIAVTPVETLTGYPSILGGRVKTLHPKVFGGILSRRDLDSDLSELAEFEISPIDLVIVDLYPFEQTVASGGSHAEIIEKIDIGGISLIRAAAKNYRDVAIVSSKVQYSDLLQLLESQNGCTTESDRAGLAGYAFHVSSNYDTAIFNYLNAGKVMAFKQSSTDAMVLRYGENPHQEGVFFGKLDEMFHQVSGKQLSYNNLLDVDAAVALMAEFQQSEPTFAILKHNNACGMATRSTLSEAYLAALAGDPTSAFGGILIANRKIDISTANHINELFCEIVIAPAFDSDAQTLLESKKNRILLVQTKFDLPAYQYRSILNGTLVQNRDNVRDNHQNFELKTNTAATASEMEDLEFASAIAKHTKSNTIVLAKNKQLLGSGTGQTSRVDALKQAVAKANLFGFDLNGAVMASDAFFPFADCVEIAHNAGITAVIQPGGSVKDQLSIDYCNSVKMAMVFTGTRHFKH
jgi:phosphoribosylaminoimidazolecarboxamide formyltransferase / IMP cyclohydrolase